MSRHLSELERWLGVALLEKRDARGLRATAPGQLLAEAARGALHGIEQAIAAIPRSCATYDCCTTATHTPAGSCGGGSTDPRRWMCGAAPRFASSDLVLRAAAQGLGVALAPHRLAQEELSTGVLLRPCAARAAELGPAYWMVTPHGRASRPAVAMLAAWLRREASLTPGAARHQ